MDTKLRMRLACVAAAFSVLAAMPAAAADDCKETVTAEGKPASLRDLGAYPNSLLAWRSAVKDKFGGEYNSWRYSKDAKVDCTEKAGQWVCVRTAKPCKDLLSRAMGGAKEAHVRRKSARRIRSARTAPRRRSQKDAQAEAQTGWEIDARKKHGKEWGVWKNASSTDIDCHDVKRRHPVHRRRHALQGEITCRVRIGQNKSGDRDARSPPFLYQLARSS